MNDEHDLAMETSSDHFEVYLFCYFDVTYYQ